VQSRVEPTDPGEQVREREGLYGLVAGGLRVRSDGHARELTGSAGHWRLDAPSNSCSSTAVLSAE
jgi:hypothetical protein